MDSGKAAAAANAGNETQITTQADNAPAPQADIAQIWNDAVEQSIAEKSRITVTLTSDWLADSTGSFGDEAGKGIDRGRIYVPVNADMVIDLNGHTIDRGLTSGIYAGSVICVNGTLTLKDSLGSGVITGGNESDGEYGGGGVLVVGGTLTTSVAISGNTAMYGGGIGVFNSTLYIEGGSITQNTANSSCSGGIVVDKSSVYISSGSVSYNTGGIYVRNGGYLEMNGGNVSFNSHEDNGGILIRNGSTFIMNAGEISNNVNLKNIGYAGGVSVRDGSEFTMNSGSVSGNVCRVERFPYYEQAAGGVLVEGHDTSGKKSLFTMNGGSISGNDTGSHGGGVGVFSAKFIMNDGTISGNTHSLNNNGWSAAAIYLREAEIPTEYTEETATFIMYGGSVNSNKSEQVGAIHTTSNVYIIMYGGEFVSNTSVTALGAGILLWRDDANGVDFDGVKSSPVGGRLDMYGGSIRNNFSHSQGGGVALGTNCTFNMYGGEIINNNATSYGGGVYASDSSATINLFGGVISGNKANYSGVFTVTADPNDSTKTINKPATYGGGVYYNNCNFTVGGSIQIYDNRNGYAGYESVSDDVYIYNSWTNKIKLDDNHPLTSARINVRVYTAPTLTAAADSTNAAAVNIITNATAKTLSGKDVRTFVASDYSFTPVLSVSGNTVQLISTKQSLVSLYWRIYDGTDYIYTTVAGNYTLNYTGKTYSIIATGTATGTTSLVTVTPNVTAKNVGVYTFTVDNNGTTTYSNPTFTLTVEKAELSVSWSTNKFTYSGVNVCPTPTIIGAADGEKIEYNLNKPALSRDVGTYQANVSLTNAAVNNNYTLNLGSANVTYSISPATVSKPYSGGTMVYNGEWQLLIGGFNSVAMQVEFDVGSKEQKDLIYGLYAGTYNATVNLSSKQNYRWEDGTTSAVYLTATINKATLSAAGISLANKQYDGTPNVKIDADGLTILGVADADYLGGEIDKDKIWIAPVDAVGEYIELSGSNAGKYTYNVAVKLIGSMVDNYELQADNYECVVYIYRAEIKVTGGITVAETSDSDGNAFAGKIYDGTNSIVLDTSGATFYHPDGAVVKDVQVEAFGAFSTANAGVNVPVNIWNIRLSGVSADNYDLQVEASLKELNGKLFGEIKPKELNVTFTTSNAVYGNQPTVSYSISGVQSSDNVVLALSYNNQTDNTTAFKTVGVYDITAEISDPVLKNNYTLDENTATVEITKATLNVKVNDNTLTYGEAKAHGGVTVSGFVYGDTRASLGLEDGDLTFTYGDFDLKGGVKGDYELSINDVTLDNYNLSITAGTLTVLLKGVDVTLTITDGVYADAANLTVTPTATDENGDAVTLDATDGYTYLYMGTSFDGTVYNGATKPIKAGEYTVKVTVVSNKYEGFATAIVKVDRATLTVTVTAKADGSDKVEYGADITDLSVHFKAEYSGFVNGDDKQTDGIGGTLPAYGDIDITALVYTTDYFRYAPVGNYNVVASGLASNNYKIIYVDGSLTVEKADATVTVKNQIGVYSGNVPVAGNVTGVNYTVSGLKRAADDLGVSISIKDAAADAGKYALLATASNGNYNVVFSGETATNTATDDGNGVWTVEQAYTVEKAKLVITAKSYVITYGDGAPDYKADFDGFVNGEDDSVFTASLSFACAYLIDLNNRGAKTYAIVVSAAEADNYDIEFVDGTLTVEKKEITVTVKNDLTTTQYGVAPIVFTDANVDGYYEFDSSELAYTDDELGIAFAIAVTATSSAGVYPIIATWNNANYEVTFENCVYTVTQFEIKVIWVDADGVDESDGVTNNWNFSYNAQEQGPSAYFIKPDGSKYTFTGNNPVTGWQKNVGTGYTATVVIPSASKMNYTFADDTSNTHSFTITPKQLQIIWSTDGINADGEYEFEYNGHPRYPTVTFNGVFAGDDVQPIYTEATGSVGRGHVTIAIADTNYTLRADEITKYYNIVKMLLDSFYWTSNGTDKITGTTYTYTYNGEVQMPTALAGFNGVEGEEIAFGYTVTYADGSDCGNRAVSAGTYKVTALPVDSNYAIPDGKSNTFTFTIAAKEVKAEDVKYSALTFVYNGMAQQPEAYYEDVNGAKIYLRVTVDGDHADATASGSYYTAVVSKPEDKNYAFTGNAENYEQKFTVTKKDINVEWKLDGLEWGDANFTYNGKEYDADATASMVATYENEVKELGLSFKVTRKNPITGKEEPYSGIIKDAGVYTFTAYVGNAALAGNYNVAESTRQITIDRIDLYIKVNDGEDYKINYNSEAPDYNANVTFDGLLSDEEDDIIADVKSVSQWIFSSYTKGSQPDEYPVTLTTNEEKLKLLREILWNYNWEGANFTGVKIIVDSVDGSVYILAENGSNEFIYNGEARLPEAFYTPATGDGSQRQLKVTLLSTNPDGTANEYLTNGEAIEEGIYYVSVERYSGDNDQTALTTDGLYFRIVKRTVIIKIQDRETTYGEVTESNKSGEIVTDRLYEYGGKNGYDPLPADVAGLAINIDCNFLDADGNPAYDVQGFAQVGSYLIEGSWNKADYGRNYEVIFIGSQHGANGQFTAGLFTVNKAKITVTSSGDEYFEETGNWDSTDPYYVISLVDKYDGTDTYRHIHFAGNTQAKVDVTFASLQKLDSATTPKEDEYTLTDAPRIRAAGEWVIYFKIVVGESKNHETYYGQWRVLVLAEDDYIIVIFKENLTFSVPYGEGVPENLIELLDDYYDLKNSSVSKDWIKTHVEASVYGVEKDSEVGLYNIYFSIKDGVETDSINYNFIYRQNNNSPESNIGKYRIEQRTLTVTWDDTLTFLHDGEAHIPEMKLSGWRDGGEITLNEITANGEKKFIYTDNGKQIVVTVTADGDFTSIGGHQLAVSVGNPNYKLEVTNAARVISIEADTKVDYKGLPAWAWYVIGGVAALFLMIIGILVVLASRRKTVVEGGFIDEDGFSDIYGENDEEV